MRSPAAQRGERSTSCWLRSSSRSSDSASSWCTAPAPVQATVQHHDPQFFLKRQAAYRGGCARDHVRGRAASTTTASTSSPIRSSRSSRLLMVVCVIGFGHSGGGAARWLADRSRARPAGGDGEGRPRHLARVLARQEGRASEDLHRRLPAAPPRGRRLHVPLHEAAGLRERRRASAPHVHDALRGRGQDWLHPRRVHPRRGASRGWPSISEYRYRALDLAWLQHGPAPTGPRVPAFPERHVVRLGRHRGRRAWARASDALFAGGAHRLHRRNRGRGARIRRGRGSVCRVPPARGARRARGIACPGRLRRLSRVRALDDIRRYKRS